VFSRRSIFSAVAVAGLTAVAGCNYQGEEPVKEKDFAASSTVQTAIGASGSTFVSPLMAKWVTAYESAHRAVQVNYRAIGSGAGISELKQGTTEMAATDAPLSDEQLKDMPNVVQIPVAAGPVVAVYNVPGLKAPLRLNGSTLAGIFLGKIISWQDPAILHDNPGAPLPHAAIIVVHRSDGSGTTNILTSYLAKVSPEWSQHIGHGISVPWPVGIGEKGSSDLLDFVGQNAGTIGYAELNYATQKKLPVAAVQNRAGTYVTPNSASATAAIAAFDEDLAKDMRAPVVDPPASAKDAYPIVGITFLLFSRSNSNTAEEQAIRDFAQYAIQDGQDLAEALDYAKLPKPMQDRAVAALGAAPAAPAKSS
jgi:phosphate transport system substrate-binding protein